MSAAVPLRLVREQMPTISGFLQGAVRSYLPQSFRQSGAIRMQHPAPSADLLQHYLAWSRAEPQRYLTSIPPHLAGAKIGMGLIARLTSQSPYPMLSVLNQGVVIKVHQPLPQGEPIEMSGELVDASDDGYRARVHVRIEMGTASAPKAISIDSLAAVVLKKRPPSNEPKPVPPNYETIDTWQADADEGVKFFYLTGDFNPIHTLPMLAKRSRFKGCIMHGYGAFAQVYEAVENAGYRISEIEVRFIKPLPLPSPVVFIQVCHEPDADGRYAVRLTDADNNLYQVGSFAATRVTGAR